MSRTVWRELLSLAAEDSRERTYLERLLSLWCESHGALGAGLYLRREGDLRLQATAGDRRFPDRMNGGAEDDVLRLEIPRGLVAYRASEPVEDFDDDPLVLLLTHGLAHRQLRSRLKEHRFEVNYRGVELEALYDVGLAIASTLDMDVLSEEILLRAVSLLDARRGALYLRDDDRFRLHRTFGGDARESFVPLADAADGPGRRRLRVPEDLLAGARHLLAIPIEIDGDARGVLVVADKESRSGVGPFSPEDKRTLGLFANQAAIALENARLHRQELEKQRMEREMELAAEIQRQILPDVSPDVEGFDLVGRSRPARQVGGDYYDLLRLPDGRLRLALGDVSGKGVPAALLVSTLHSGLRLLLGDSALSADHLERLNRHVVESSASNKFITLTVSELDPTTGELRSINAGHNPALLLRADGSVDRLRATGMPVGMLPAAKYHETRWTLQPGDLLCLYSDGITEAADPDDEEFGEDRLVECLLEHRAEPLADVAEALDAAVARFVRGEPQADDETVVLLRRHG